MKTVKITCDTCKYDITTTGNCEDYRIVVKSESIQPAGPTVTAMALYPQFRESLYFCGYKCMKEWAEKYFKLTGIE